MGSLDPQSQQDRGFHANNNTNPTFPRFAIDNAIIRLDNMRRNSGPWTFKALCLTRC